MDQHVTWYKARPRPRRLCVRWSPRTPLPKRGRSPQIFGPCLLRPNGWMDEAGTWHGGRLQPSRLCVRWGPSTPPQKGAEPPSPIFGTFLLWPNGWMHQDATWYGATFRPRRLGVRWGPWSPSQKGDGASPNFSAQVYCGQTAGWIKMVGLLGMEVGLSPDGDPARLPKKRAEPPPQFSAHFYCGQTAGFIKMPLSMAVGLSSGEFF